MNDNKVKVKIFGLVIIVLVFFTFIILGVFMPIANKSLVDQKMKQMQTVVQLSITILDKYYADYDTGKISKRLAQEKAKEMLRTVRYGADRGDYVSIIDIDGISIMHPYMQTIEGTNLTGLQDMQGKSFIREILEICKSRGAGFIYYQWNYKDRKDLIVQKITYNMTYRKWNWIVGTGLYLRDIEEDVDILRLKIIVWISVLIIVVLVMTYFMTKSLTR